MQITDELIDKLSARINTEKSKKDFIYVPPYDIKKTLEVFLVWLKENGYRIINPEIPHGPG